MTQIDINPLFNKQNLSLIKGGRVLIWIAPISLAVLIISGDYLESSVLSISAAVLLLVVFGYTQYISPIPVNCEVHEGKFHFKSKSVDDVVDPKDIEKIRKYFVESKRVVLTITYRTDSGKRKVNISCKKEFGNEKIEPKTFLEKTFGINNN